MMKIYFKTWLIFFSLLTSTYALSLDEKYPSYAYVFNEFDVDLSYLDNKNFISFVKRRENKLRAFYKRSLKRGRKILPKMQGLLVNDGVSDLFIYLSMVESGFSSKIVSSKKAVGLWQFMPATARHYKLKVCKNTDERCDMVSSTNAAINYLNKLHKQFGKWYLAAMAYNCGEGRLARAIRKAGTDDIVTLTDGKLKYLPKETREYIQKILLVAMIGENNSIGYFVSQKDASEEIVEVEINGKTTLKNIANLLKMNDELLKKMNKNAHTFKGVKLRKIKIPIEKLYAFYLRYDVETFTGQTRETKTYMVMYRVKLGDTLESIAKAHHANKEQIKISNYLEDDFLTLDDFLVIPVEEEIFSSISN